jgi:pimeloyl-ACP methyl ester carboxylesterase
MVNRNAWRTRRSGSPVAARWVADSGIGDAAAVLWCHGGPGSRLEPAYLRRVASEAGLRIIGIDRPGYGLSTPQPGRTIAAWVPEALAVADHLGLGPFAAVGISTGGAYALALAALAPERVLGVVACCSKQANAGFLAMFACGLQG